MNTDIPLEEALSDDKLAEYTKAFQDHLPETLSLRMRWRSRRTGNLVPAGVIRTCIAETHAFSDGVMQLYMPEEDTDQDLTTLTLVSFPQKRIDYLNIEILPPRSGMVLCKVPRQAPLIIPPPLQMGAVFPAYAQTLPPPPQIPTTVPTQTQHAAYPTYVTSTQDDNQQTLTPAKRGRDEAEEMGDAIRGELRKKVICAGLKVPQDITPRHEFLYPSAWLERITGGESGADAAATWRANFLTFVQEGDLVFPFPQKRAEFYAVKEQLCSWIEFTAQTCRTDVKAAWALPFGLTNRLASLIALARGGLIEEATMQAAAQLAFDKGMVDYTALLSAIKNGRVGYPKEPPSTSSSNSNYNRGRGHYRGRGSRGSFRGSRGRGNPKDPPP
jgi:hypothetical protein